MKAMDSSHGRWRMRSKWLAFALCLDALLAGCTGGGRGVPVHTSPFAVPTTNAGMRWIDNSRLAVGMQDELLQRIGFQVWNVDTDVISEVPGKEIECVTLGQSPPKLLLRGFTALSSGSFPRYYGTLEHHERSPVDDNSWHPLTRKIVLPGHGEITQWLVRDGFSPLNCHGRWLPDAATPAHMVDAMQQRPPLFGGTVAYGGGSALADNDPIRIVRAALSQPVVPEQVQCIRSVSPYYAFKKAYLLVGAQRSQAAGYSIGPKGCMDFHMYGDPWPYGWLYEDGRIEYGLLPPVLPLFAEKHQANMRRYTRSDAFYPTAAGFLYVGEYRYDTTRGAMYLLRNGQYEQIYQGARIGEFSLVVSPDGCRVAFSDPSRGSTAKTRNPVKVIDLCRHGAN